MLITDSLDRIARLTAQLNDLTDRINSRIEEIELVLIEAGVSGGYTDTMTKVAFPSEELQFALQWEKVDGKWGIYVEGIKSNEYSGNKIRLRESPRAFRLAAYPYLEDLLDNITSVTQDELKRAKAMLCDLVDEEQD